MNQADVRLGERYIFHYKPINSNIVSYWIVGKVTKKCVDSISILFEDCQFEWLNNQVHSFDEDELRNLTYSPYYLELGILE